MRVHKCKYLLELLVLLRTRTVGAEKLLHVLLTHQFVTKILVVLPSVPILFYTNSIVPVVVFTFVLTTSYDRRLI